MENIVISVIAKMAEYTVKPVGCELGYVFFLHANFKKLRTQVDKLKDTKGSVQDKVLIARRNAEDIKPAVEKWLKKVVDDFDGKSEAILANEGGHGRLCSINLVQRYKLSKKARKMAKEALVMKNEGDNFDIVSYKATVSNNEISLPKVSHFMNFDSRNSTMKQIMDALCDDNVHRIGVYGMGGVGKTLLVKEISRKIMEKKSFDEVVTTTVSQTPDLKSIQGVLADKLGLKFEQETIEGRAVMLQKRLKIEKSILIVLDDIWDYIDLETIGIPSVEQHIGCKILFTSRNRHLISNEMSGNKIFEIKVLENDESWDLFEAMAGEIDEAWDVKSTATQIVRECAGLPIAITTVAKALRNKAPSIWNDALLQLKRDDMVVDISGMDKKVYSPLKLSYDYLECEEAKLLFLFCSMFPEDIDINVEELQVYAMGMGFLRGVNTVVGGRCRITKLVDDLISSSLLLQSENRNNYVKMHDMVRDVAISISSKNDHIRTLCYLKRWNVEWEDEKLLGNHTVVSLTIQDTHNNLDLPKLMLPKVQLLKIDGPWLNNTYVPVAETYFEGMKELKGLVLKKAKISLSPPSLHSFGNTIRLLRLHECKLVSIDMIGELTKLEILDFSKSNITQIPTSMSKLTQLKVLNLSSCYELEVISPNILSNLTKLEELRLETFDRWEGEEWYEGKKNASLSELRYLRYLYDLNLIIQDEEIMPKHLFAKELNFEKFDIIIGQHMDIEYDRVKKDDIYKRLNLKMESGRYLDDWIKMLLKRSEEVHLKGSICSKALQYWELLDDANHDCFLPLKHLFLYDNSELQHFIHEKNKPYLRKCLSKLEYLRLYMLENLESIIHGRYAVGEYCFKNLRVVLALYCKKLETLFFNCILGDVLNLEEIVINNCEKMMEVMSIVMENEEEATNNRIIQFTHLKSLRLLHLPRLQKFCSKIEKHGQSSQTSIISNSFFSEQVSLPDLETLTFVGVEKLKMIWSNVLIIPNSFSKLKLVDIYSCNNLQTVFPPNMINILTCLSILRIGNCELLEGIFEVQDQPISVTKPTTPIVLRNLIQLSLRNLPKLEYIWSKNDPFELQSFVNIKEVFIEECSKLKRSEYPVKNEQRETLEIDMREMIEVIQKEKSADHKMLESKHLESSKVEVIQLEDGCVSLFPKLKRLKLNGYVDYNSTHLLMEIVQLIYQLDIFELEGAFIEEILPSNKIVIKPVKRQYEKSSKIKPIIWSLYKLPKLKHLWSSSGWSQKDEASSSILQDLDILKFSECGGLSSLVPSSSSVSFTNLTRLIVDKCGGLTHLMNPSMATTLVQLEIFSLRECKRMSSVIEEGNDDETIVFNNLELLSITSCSKLTSFYSGKCIIKFPRLGNVMIKECPEMKVFSLGNVSTPHLKHKNCELHYNLKSYHPKDNLKEVAVEDINTIIRQVWNDDIDTTIPYLFGEENLEETPHFCSSDVEE